MAFQHTLTPDLLAELDQSFASARQALADLVAWTRKALDEEPDATVASAMLYVALMKRSGEVNRAIVVAALVELARRPDVDSPHRAVG